MHVVDDDDFFFSFELGIQQMPVTSVYLFLVSPDQEEQGSI